jgi:N6-adenosine-specific RNA methylase IME4
MNAFGDLPRHHFGAILADPPWRFRTYNEKGRNRCPDWKTNSLSKHYDTMSTASIAALPIANLAAADCALFMWLSWPMLHDALDLIEAWGFKYKTCAFDWMKLATSGVPAMGCGYWTRANTEPCILATQGKPKRLHADVRQAILEPRRQHSRKPDCIHQRIERLVAGPYLELFARQTKPGWTAWGNETQKFETGEHLNEHKEEPRELH